jgi:hypothetical protein
MATIFIFKERISATCNKISDMCLIAGTGITKEGSSMQLSMLQPMMSLHASLSIIPLATLLLVWTLLSC